MRTPGSPAELELKRLLAANMFDLGVAPREVAAFLGIDDQTARRWRRICRAKGREGLLSVKPPGRPPRLDDAQRGRLLRLLPHGPRALGFDADLWTQQLIADLIRREFAVSYHHDSIGVILAELNYSHQKPARRARESDPEAIEAWRRDAWPALQKKVSSPTA